MTQSIRNNGLPKFDFNTVPDVHVGPGTSSELGALPALRHLKRICIVTDARVLALGLLDSAVQSLRDHAIDSAIYSEVEPDPSDRTVEAAADFAVRHRADGIVGFGGGSSLDVAKLVATLALEKQSLDTLYGVDKISASRLPLIQVPTTAGTGSEATMVAVVTTGETTKAGVVSRVLLADAIVLDPLLTLGLPPEITAATGIDAMVHAIEAFTSKRLKNPVSDGLALNALSLLASSIHCAVRHGDELTARSNMLLGAMQAGQAFANAPVGGVHALAYPLGGVFHIAHGLSNSLVLPHVLRFNGPSAMTQYQQLAEVVLTADQCRVPVAADSAPADSQFGWAVEGCTAGAVELAHYFEQLAPDLGIESRLREVGVPQTALEELADSAMVQERLLINNPRTISRQDALNIYRAAW